MCEPIVENIKFYVRNRNNESLQLKQIDKVKSYLSTRLGTAGKKKKTTPIEAVPVLSKVKCTSSNKKSCAFYHIRDKPVDHVVTEESFDVDRYFDSSASQEELYDVTSRSIVSSAMMGYSGTILTYGPRSSGKTFTMRGGDDSSRGIIPRCIEHLLQEKDEDTEIWLSYVQIYCETITDLLSGQDGLELQHTEHDDGSFVKELSSMFVTKVEDINFILDKRNEAKRRSNRKARANRERVPHIDGHCVMIIKLKQRRVIDHNGSSNHLDRPETTSLYGVMTGKGKEVDLQLSDEDPIAGDDDRRAVAVKAYTGARGRRKGSDSLHLLRETTLCLADLAGMERAVKTECNLDEFKAVNYSLACLGKCITSMIEQQAHIPYRYSKLTRLLQGFMGNTYRTAFITHVAPKTDCGVESLNALRLIFEASQLQVHVPVAPYHPDKSYYDSRRTESILVTPLTIEQFMRSTKRRISQWKYRELTFNSQEKEHREYLIYTNDIQMRVQSINHALYADGFRTLARSKEDIKEIGRHHCRSFKKHVRRFRDLYDSYREQERIDAALHRVVIKPASLISSFVRSNCEIMPDDSLYDSDEEEEEEDSGSLFGVRLFRTLRPKPPVIPSFLELFHASAISTVSHSKASRSTSVCN